MGWKIQCIAFLVSLLMVAIAQQDEVEENCDAENGVCTGPLIEYKEKCSIYMAPSSVKGIDGMGVFTTEEMNSGDLLLSGYDGPSIPVLDPRRSDRDSEALAEQRKRWTELFDGYWWGRGVPDHTKYEANQVLDLQITFGALPNHHCALHSISYTFQSPNYEDNLVDPDLSPGVGAFSYHNGRTFHVKRRLGAGSEIFLNYGHCSRENNYPKWAEFIPMSHDFYQAASYTVRIWDSLEGNLADTTKINSVIEHYKENITNPLVRNLIPATAEQLLDVIKSANRWYTIGIVRQIATQVGTTPRSPNWIRKHGLCVENLIPGESYLPDAGRGAFAHFAMKKDEIVVPVPTLQIVNKDVLTMWDPETGTRNSTQLLINYCFGHSESSLLLCPITNAILINHCSSRKPGPGCKNGPNAKVQRASAWDGSGPQWWDMSMEELALQESRGINMEIVALRDIMQGEEVFIDYGPEWEAAWEKHVASWTPPQRSKRFMPAVTANRIPTLALKQFISHDLRKVKNHPNLFTACIYWDSTLDSEVTIDGDPNWWKKLSDEELMNTSANDGSRFTQDYEEHSDKSHFKCHVIDSNERGTKYTVRIVVSKKHVPVFLYNYPRDSIHFFSKPYSSDQHLPNAFRHHIGIADEIMPVQWKDRANKPN